MFTESQAEFVAVQVGLRQYFYHLIAQQIHPLHRHLGVLEGLLLVGGEDVLHVVGQTEHPPPQTVVGLHLLAQSGELEIPINTHIAKYILSEISISILFIGFVVVL